MDETTRDTHVFLAKLAEQAERYDGMYCKMNNNKQLFSNTAPIQSIFLTCVFCFFLCIVPHRNGRGDEQSSS